MNSNHPLQEPNGKIVLERTSTLTLNILSETTLLQEIEEHAKVYYSSNQRNSLVQMKSQASISKTSTHPTLNTSQTLSTQSSKQISNSVLLSLSGTLSWYIMCSSLFIVWNDSLVCKRNGKVVNNTRFSFSQPNCIGFNYLVFNG